ncbi:uncharacterized protein LOC126034692 [Accipiter gentilis]|nr:uncharacterized protein LOC126034692 [Accipiter gentilis]
MIEYCTKVWGGKKISKNVFWPVYGSEEDWVRQQLNLWVNNKKPLNPEESQYAEVWLERPGARLYPLNEVKTKQKKKKEERAGMRLWDAQHAQGPQADIKWPLQRPNWDNQDPVHRTHMQDLRTIVIQGIREAVPRGQNINKAFNEMQKKDESPTEWLERLRKALQLYSGVNPDDPLGQALLKTQFVAKSWEDIRKKIEKLEDWQNRGLDELLREAQKIYVRREEESSKRQVKMMVAAVREGRKGQIGEHKSAGMKQGNVVVRKEQRCCFYCGKKGHIKKNCRERIRDEEILKTE